MADNFISFSNVKSFLFENKTLHQTIFKNTFWLVVAEVIDRGCGFLVMVMVARHFGPGIYGKFAFAVSFVAFFLIFADFGFSPVALRDIAQDKSKMADYIDNILAMRIIFGIVAFGMIACVIHFLGKDIMTVRLVYFMGIYYILNLFFVFLRIIFEANEKMQFETVCRGLQSLSELALVFIFVIFKYSIFFITYSYIIGCLMGIALSLLLIWRYFSKIFVKINLKICREILLESLPFVMIGIISTAYSNFGIIFLSLSKADKAVGFYNVAAGLFGVVLIIPGLFMNALYPRMASMYKESKESFKTIFIKLTKYTAIFAVIILPLFFIFSKEIILLLYGKSYLESVNIFRILLLVAFFDFFLSIFYTAIYIMKKQAVYTKFMVLVLVFNVTLCFILIPKYSYVGLAVVALVSDIFLLSLSFIYIIKKLFNKKIIYGIF